MVADSANNPLAGLLPRERLLESAYGLFVTRGIRDVGIDEILARAGVARATLYNNFHCKDNLVLAVLERREERWVHGWLRAEALRRAADPEGQLLAIFDVFDEWFHHPDFEGCSFIQVLLEMGPAHPAGRASIEHLKHIRAFLQELASDAGLRAPASFARSCHILMKGAIVAAVEGDRDAATRAKRLALSLLEDHRAVR